jgi:hypothetical protein
MPYAETAATCSVALSNLLKPGASSLFTARTENRRRGVSGWPRSNAWGTYLLTSGHGWPTDASRDQDGQPLPWHGGDGRDQNRVTHDYQLCSRRCANTDGIACGSGERGLVHRRRQLYMQASKRWPLSDDFFGEPGPPRRGVQYGSVASASFIGPATTKVQVPLVAPSVTAGGAHGISGAEGRPVVPSAWRWQLALGRALTPEATSGEAAMIRVETRLS